MDIAIAGKGAQWVILARSARDQYDADTGHGCGSAGQFGASGDADGDGARRLLSWQRFLRFDPEDPIWPNRDRFVLSAGHASMLLYSLLYLTGVKAVDPQYERLGTPSVTLDDIKRFRQLDSKCPGHPEYRWTSGVETTTGPLGQGLATSVGMAIAGRWLGQHLNRPDFPMFDYDQHVSHPGAQTVIDPQQVPTTIKHTSLVHVTCVLSKYRRKLLGYN